MDLFNKVHIFECMKSHIYEPNISLIGLMFSYAKPRIKQESRRTYGIAAITVVIRLN